MEKHIDQIGMKKDAVDMEKWCDAVCELSRNMRLIRLPALTQTKPD